MSNEYEAASRVIGDWYLGQTSQRYESSGVGAGEISSGRNDHGGVSYGTYQLSSKAGTVQEYLAQSAYGAQFKGLSPATPEFDGKWREIARVDPGFGRDQHDFIGRTHFQEQVARLNAMSLRLDGRGRAVQDALWSTSVQFRDLTTTIFSSGLEEKFGDGFSLDKLSDRQIVEAVQDYKINHNDALFKSSSGLWPGLIKRAHSEKAVLLKLADCETLVRADPNAKETTATYDRRFEERTRGSRSAHRSSANHATTPHSLLRQGSSGHSVEHLQQQLHNLNYRTRDGHPLPVNGHFGPETDHAVRAFQREHGLHVDGVVGKDTRSVLAATQANPFASKYHPHHALYEQALHQVHVEESHRHVQSGPHSEALAGALTVAAANQGLSRIDRVQLNDAGTLVRAIQVSPVRDEPGLNHATMPIGTQQAMHTPLLHSSDHLQQAPRHHDVPSHVQASPSMAM